MTATTLADRAVIRLSGEDVRGFLQGLVTSDVAGPLPVWAGLLTPQGKVLFDFLIWDDGDDVLIDCEAEQAEALDQAEQQDPQERVAPVGRLELAERLVVLEPPGRRVPVVHQVKDEG